jgi:hypothetical protein
MILRFSILVADWQMNLWQRSVEYCGYKAKNLSCLLFSGEEIERRFKGDYP